MRASDVIEALGALCLVMAAAIALGLAAALGVAGVALLAKSVELDMRRFPRPRPDARVPGPRT